MMLLIFLSRGWFTNPQKLNYYQIALFGVVFFINDLFLSIEEKSTEVYIALTYIGFSGFAIYNVKE